MKRRFGLLKWLILCGLTLPGLLGCNILDYIIWYSEPKPPTLTPTITIDPDAPTQTPTPINCFWNWAYGEGSESFDRAVEQQLSETGIQAVVNSTSYGETYSCARTYYPRNLDVSMQISVNDFSDPETLQTIADRCRPILIEQLPISEISQIGNISLEFVDSSQSRCFWNFTESRCAE